MTSKRTMLSLGRDASEALTHVAKEIERLGHKVVWLSEPEPVVAFGLPNGTSLYEIRAVVRFAA
jgi:hypothetical protein